jgi:hypothetical protein
MLANLARLPQLWPPIGQNYEAAEDFVYNLHACVNLKHQGSAGRARPRHKHWQSQPHRH